MIDLAFDPSCGVAIDGRVVSLSMVRDGRRLGCVLTQVEALLCSLMERGRDPVGVVEVAMPGLAGIDELCARLAAGLRGFAPADGVAAEPVFPAPSVFADLGGHVVRPGALRREFLPREVVWYATHRCPRMCRYCHWVDKGRSDVEPDQLGVDDLRAIARDVAQCGVERFVATGGEPMLRRDLPEVLALFADEGVDTLLFTRHPFTAERAARLARSGVSEIYYSLDDVSAEVNAVLVENGRVAIDAERSLRALVDAGLTVTAAPVLTSLNARAIPELVDALAGWGVRSIRPLAYKPRRGAAANDLLALSSEDKRAVLAGLAYAETKLSVDRATLALDSDVCVCESGLATLYVQPNGDVAYCPIAENKPRMAFGRLPRDSISALWQSSRLGEFLHLAALDLVDARTVVKQDCKSSCVLRELRLDLA